MTALFYKVILYTCLFPTMLCKYIKGKEHVPQAKKKTIGEYRNMRYSF